VNSTISLEKQSKIYEDWMTSLYKELMKDDVLMDALHYSMITGAPFYECIEYAQKKLHNKEFNEKFKTTITE